MKKMLLRIIPVLAVVLTLGLFADEAFAQVYVHANGGAYWSQSGGGWNSINNDGYCVSGRGPCSSNLWYLQYNYNHSGCGSDAYARYNMAAVLDYNGDTYAWIDSSTGTMYGADYSVTYNYGSSYSATVNQRAYSEAFAVIAIDKWRTSIVWETDGWGSAYACNSLSGYQVEFDEVKLEI